jgi:UDP-2,3-diacylglucosamine hydrolase
MNVYYVSDLHLRSQEDRVAKYLLDFLNKMPAKGDILILGGDIFDLFIGNKKVFRKNFAKVISAIRDLDCRGCYVYYLEGNHDFHLRQVFRHQKNILVEENDFEVRAGRRTFWFSHGDQIDQTDRGYLMLRSVTRSVLFQAVMGLIPDQVFSGIGKWSSKTSRKYTSGPRMSDNSQDRVRSLYKDFAKERISRGYDYVLVGHSHLVDDVEISSGTRKGRYMNLGFSDTQLLYAHFNSGDDTLTMKTFPN